MMICKEDNNIAFYDTMLICAFVTTGRAWLATNWCIIYHNDSNHLSVTVHMNKLYNKNLTTCLRNFPSSLYLQHL